MYFFFKMRTFFRIFSVDQSPINLDHIYLIGMWEDKRIGGTFLISCLVLV